MMVMIIMMILPPELRLYSFIPTFTKLTLHHYPADDSDDNYDDYDYYFALSHDYVITATNSMGWWWKCQSRNHWVVLHTFNNSLTDRDRFKDMLPHLKMKGKYVEFLSLRFFLWGDFQVHVSMLVASSWRLLVLLHLPWMSRLPCAYLKVHGVLNIAHQIIIFLV